MIAGKLALGLFAGILAAVTVLFLSQSIMLALVAYSAAGVALTLAPIAMDSLGDESSLSYAQRA